MSDEETYLIGVEVKKTAVTDIIVKVAASSKENAIAKATAAGISFIENPYNESTLSMIDSCHWAEKKYDATGKVYPDSYPTPPYTDEDVTVDLTLKDAEEE
jgi:hypothetical protein